MREREDGEFISFIGYIKDQIRVYSGTIILSYTNVLSSCPNPIKINNNNIPSSTYQKQHSKINIAKATFQDLVCFTWRIRTHSKQQPIKTKICPCSPYVLCPFTPFSNWWIPINLFPSLPCQLFRRYDLELFDVIWYNPFRLVRHRINGPVISHCPKFCPVILWAQLMILYVDLTSTTISSRNLKEI